MGHDSLNGKTVCEEIKEKLVCGEELSDAEKTHVLSCDGCRTYSDEIKTMLADLENIGKESENLEKDGKTLVSSVMNEVNARKFFGNTGKKGGFSAWTKHFGLVAACLVLMIMAFPLIRNYGNLSKKDAVVYSDSTESINDSASKDQNVSSPNVTKIVPIVSSGISDDEEEPAAENKAESDELPGRGVIVRSAPGGMSVGAAAGGKSSGADSEEISSRESSAIEDFYQNFNNDSLNTSIYGSYSGNGAVIITSPAVADSPDTVTGEDESVSEGDRSISDGVGLYVGNEDGSSKKTDRIIVFEGAEAGDSSGSSMRDEGGKRFTSEDNTAETQHFKDTFDYTPFINMALERCNSVGVKGILSDAELVNGKPQIFIIIANEIITFTFDYDETAGLWVISKETEAKLETFTE